MVNVIRARSPSTKILALALLAKGLWTSTNPAAPLDGGYVNMIHGPYRNTAYGFTGQLYQDDGTGVNDRLKAQWGAAGSSYAFPSARDSQIHFVDVNYGPLSTGFMRFDKGQWFVDTTYYRPEPCFKVNGADVCGKYVHLNPVGYGKLAKVLQAHIWELGTAP